MRIRREHDDERDELGDDHDREQRRQAAELRQPAVRLRFAHRVPSCPCTVRQYARQPGARCEALGDPGTKIADFRRADLVRHRIAVPFDVVAECDERIAAARARASAARPGRAAVAHEDRHVSFAGGASRRREAVQRQVSRKRHDAGEFRRVAHAAGERDRAALREAGEDHALGRNPALGLARDQRFDLADRCANAGDILLRRDLRREDVVPRAHAHAAVDRDRAHGRVRKHEADRRPARSTSSGTIGSKSWPSAPRPCSQMIAWRGFGAVSSSMV